MPIDPRFLSERFPRASAYGPDWMIAGAGSGSNTLWLTEWLTTALDLRSGMRVLDLGCGRAVSSIFLRREFGVQVWAVDLWFSPTENARRIRDAGVEDGVFPIRADARSLPFARDFFDAIVCINSYEYYGTDDLYLPNLARFARPGAPIGVAGAGFTREIDGPVPDHLRGWWAEDRPLGLHSLAWWRRHWERTGIVEILVADTMQDGWQAWLDWQETAFPDNRTEIEAVEADRGEYLGYFRLVGRRNDGVDLHDPIESLPPQYEKRPLLRTD